MGTYRKILLATDFSAQARKAAAEAVRLARSHDAQLHVVHVEVVQVQGLGRYADVSLPEYVRSMGQLASGADFDLNYKNAVMKVVRDRSEAAGILRYAAEQHVDLIVLGTHGRNALSELVLGSVAQAVAREAPAAVLVVGAHARHAEGTGAGCVLAPVDFSATSAAALAQAGRLAARRGARLVPLHVVDFDRAPQPLSGGERERRARASLQALAAGAGFPDAEPVVTVGPAADEVLRIAAKYNAALIVIAPSSHGGLERLLLGSVCRSVIRGAPCPVLVHREPAEPRSAAA